MDDSWAGSVYRKSAKMKGVKKDNWTMVRARVWRSAGGRCERCDQLTFLNRGVATAHHIIPRDKGGNDDITNLIWLCNDCHNYVEDNVTVFITKLLIKESFEEKIDSGEVETDWHAWVYGSARNPMFGGQQAT